eukprot:2919680-Amphidinium_carterae.1
MVSTMAAPGAWNAACSWYSFQWTCAVWILGAPEVMVERFTFARARIAFNAVGDKTRHAMNHWPGMPRCDHLC